MLHIAHISIGLAKGSVTKRRQRWQTWIHSRGKRTSMRVW